MMLVAFDGNPQDTDLFMPSGNIHFLVDNKAMWLSDEKI